jgi:hypothetical protein
VKKKEKDHPIYDAAVAIPVNRTAVWVTRKRFQEKYEPDLKLSPQVHSKVPLPTKDTPQGSMPNLVGTVFGRFIVVGVYAGTKGKWTGGRWVVRCRCGCYETRSTKAVGSQKNNWDRCRECQHLMYLKRQDVFLRTGKWPPYYDYY